MNRCPWWLPGASALIGAGLAQAADSAAPMRDPMLPPAAAQAPARTADMAPVAAEATPRHLMVIDGRRYVIDGGRRLAVGDLLGASRIERIDDGAVWLREAGTLRQVSLFGGIVKRMQAPAAAASGPALPASGRAVQRDAVRLPNSTLPTDKRS